MSLKLEAPFLPKETYVNYLIQQLSEFELLNSMYPNPGEIVLTDKNNIQNIEEFIENKCEYIPMHLDFTINLCINDFKLEVCVNLPSCYPDEEPDIYLRCNQLNRQQETCLNSDLAEYIKSIHVGEVCLYSVVTWLQDNIEDYKIQETKLKNFDKNNVAKTDQDKFVRMWIFSHHIYNKKKREEIVKKAKDYKLSGFCLPGKPGVICIEGEDSSCQQWWRDIKAMSWKKIVVRKTESLVIFDKEKIFSGFEEIHFKSNINNKHSNMSEFSKFMQDHGLTSIFYELFGLSNE
ncbi:RWD domain-containing protein 2A [Manduca sexta]|uniref:RWD domain-containing protein 2A n=1 Tax=Manduca sexta TaxID=7130 RepID=UPI00188FA945|nr:RWD domain-containing protein 2A [Manduca sexta]